MPTLLHASAVQFEGLGLLLIGDSGAGKSDLLLRLMDAGGTLIADDQAIMQQDRGTLYARAPDRLAGLVEIRGVGIIRMPTYLQQAPIQFVFQLVKQNEVERLPEHQPMVIEGLSLPCIRLFPFEVSALAKIRALMAAAKEKRFVEGAL